MSQRQSLGASNMRSSDIFLVTFYCAWSKHFPRSHQLPGLPESLWQHIPSSVQDRNNSGQAAVSSACPTASVPPPFLLITLHVVVRACPSVQLLLSQRAIMASDEGLFPRPMEVKGKEVDEIQFSRRFCDEQRWEQLLLTLETWWV